MKTGLSLSATAAQRFDSPPAVIPSVASQVKGRQVRLVSAAQPQGAQTAAVPMHRPTPARVAVSQRDAEAALERILGKIPPRQDGPPPLSLKELEKIPMDAMMLASTLLSSEILGSTALAKSKALAIMTDKQERIRQQEIRDCREEMDKAVEKQDKARKAGIFSVIFDWVIAAVEVVSGVLKIVGGVLTGNVSTVAGGAMDLLAGLAGTIKAIINTVALIDPDNKEAYEKIAKTVGYVQLSFEIAGALVDVTSAVRNLVLTKVIPKVTGTVLKKGADAALVQAIKNGSKTAVDQTAKQVGQQVASQVAEQIIQGLTKATLEASKATAKAGMQRFVQQFGVNQMLKQFSQQAIETLVTQAVARVGHQAIEKGVQKTVEQVTKEIVKAVRNDVIKAVVKASAYVGIHTTRGALAGASQITSGALAVDRARLQKEIDQLVLDQQWLQALFALYQSEKDAALKRMSELVEGQSLVLEDGSKAIANAGAVQVQIAAAMV
ncbi:secreted effector protein SseC [Pseudomonas sp. JAI115]|uniref:type III secretion system translocon subunit SctE n=1 Tax=Pseudomonas sp. JAI115 TaxID=2723061 RepID=UPI0016210D26|nr:type III secretion system translocon subunit SctE [Pseudomonas sp. JAI115]MBB6155177.1 secreted effector protein SseC [Pseudomonas sp. JAI115]